MSGYWCLNLITEQYNNIMKKIIVICLIAYSILSCTNNSDAYDPLKVTTASQQDSLLLDVIIYTDEHTPDSINAANRFEEKNKPFFAGLTSKYRFKYLSKNAAGQYKYFIYKKARGTEDLFVGMGGTFTVSGGTKISNLEETFRMWRMTEKELDPKALEVYQKFVEDKPLTEYMNSEEKQYIEFPSEHVTYDAAKHEWKIVKLYK
jgi:hypothetical protein